MTHIDGSRPLEPSVGQPRILRVSRGLPDIQFLPVRLVQRALLLVCDPVFADGDGGDEETRTPDPLLAKEMLFQLSYVPLFGIDGLVVGVSGLEPETSALSGQCSNQLS